MWSMYLKRDKNVSFWQRMKKDISFLTLLLCTLVFMVTVTGCGTERNKDLFDGVEEQMHAQLERATSAKSYVETEEQKEDAAVFFSLGNLPEYWFNFGIYAKRWAAVIMVGSLACGWIVYDIFKRNKEVQKWALDLLIIRIPFFTFLIVYVYAFLYRMLNL